MPERGNVSYEPEVAWRLIMSGPESWIRCPHRQRRDATPKNTMKDDDLVKRGHRRMDGPLHSRIVHGRKARLAALTWHRDLPILFGSADPPRRWASFS